MSIEAQLLEVGCGNGLLARHLPDPGRHVTAIDVSISDIALAKRADTSEKFREAPAYDGLRKLGKLG